METKVFFKVYQLLLNIKEESEIGTFENEQDAMDYARLMKIVKPRYGFKAVKATEELLFSTEVEEKGE